MSIEQKVTVESFDVQPNGNIKISSLLRYFQKAAGDDVNKTDLNYNNLSSHNIAFVITKMSLKILDDIKLYDELSIISHPRKTKGVTFPRDFIVKRNDIIVALASSNWVLLDLVKRSILRPSAIDDIGYLPPSDEDLFEFDDIRLIIDDNSLQRTDVRRVCFSNLDMNNHLNNTYYSDFVFDNIDPKAHVSDKNMYLQINYKNEAKLDEVIEIFNYSADQNSFSFCAKNNTNNNICFTAYVSFK